MDWILDLLPLQELPDEDVRVLTEVVALLVPVVQVAQGCRMALFARTATVKASVAGNLIKAILRVGHPLRRELLKVSLQLAVTVGLGLEKRSGRLVQRVEFLL